MLTRLAILLGIVLGVLGAAIEDKEDAEREGKLWWPVKYVVDYRNTSCTTDSGYDGYCFTEFECTKGDGVADGTCGPNAQETYGVCCDYTAGGTTTISGSAGGSFSNKGYPKADGKTGITMATLEPPSGTCQIKLTFEDFDLLPPTDGDCTNDTFVFSGANSDFEVPILCGYNKGQHMYINIDNSDGPFKIIQTSSDTEYDRKFNVDVDFLGMSDPNCAPPRCLQYYPDEEGELMSFNYNQDGDSLMLNNQNYVICFGYNTGKCDIGINMARLDHGPQNDNCNDDDYLSIGCQRVCGDYLARTIQANSTGSPVQYIHVSSDDDNSQQMEGFMGSYMMMPCN